MSKLGLLIEKELMYNLLLVGCQVCVLHGINDHYVPNTRGLVLLNTS